MDFCTAHFGKKLGDLEYHDVESFFKVDRLETDQLEFKSYAGAVDKNLPGLVKSICGFLNSKGGLIIWGGPIGSIPAGKTEKSFVGSLSPIKEAIEKDRVISKISDRIIPLPQGIRLQILEGQKAEFIGVIEIDESDYSPHQTEGTYYMRMDGQTRPAPHHYVEALMRKIRFPNLEGYIKLMKVENTRVDVNSILFSIEFELQFHNWSPLQNVEEMLYRVSIDRGDFVKAIGTSGYMGPKAFKSAPFQVLHYGLALRETHEFTIHSEIAAKNNYKTTVRLFFGGKNCPAKMSSCVIDLSKNKGGDWDSQMVVDRTENRLMKEIQDSLGSTKLKILEQALGRIPR